MSRLVARSSLLCVMLLSSGCAMCCAPHDEDYPFVGGRWVRHNPTTGRVGSAFDEAGGPVEVAPSTTAAEPVPTPAPAAPPATQSVIPRNLGERYLPTR